MSRTSPRVASSPPELVEELSELTGVQPLVVNDTPDPADLLGSAGLRVTTMGRDVSEDPLFFAAAVAAGALAADLAADRSTTPVTPRSADRPVH